MPRRKDACAGRENKPYVEAWDAFAETVTAWHAAWSAISPTAAELLADWPAETEPDDLLLEELAAVELPQIDGRPVRLPDPPVEPAVACTLGEPVTAGGSAVWCPTCRRRIRAAITEVGDLAAKLESWADGHRGAASGEHIPTRRTTAPSVSPITNEIDKLYGMVAEVERQWREHAGHSPRPGRSRGADARQRTLDYLLAHADHILDNPGSVRFGRGILAWEAKLRKLTKTDPVVRNRPGRCPRCAYVNVLYVEDEITKCRNCNRWMNEEEYERDVLGSGDVSVVADSIAARAAS